MFLSMNWIQDFVDLSGLDKIELIRKFSLSTAGKQPAECPEHLSSGTADTVHRNLLYRT